MEGSIVILSALTLFLVAITLGGYYSNSERNCVQEVQEALDIMNRNYQKMVDNFAHGEYQSAWRDVISLEAAYLFLIVFIDSMTFDGGEDKRKQMVVDLVIERWGGFILKLYRLPIAAEGISMVRTNLKRRRLAYAPLMNEIISNTLYNSAQVDRDCHFCALYAKFIELALDNYHKIMSHEDLVLKFHNNPSDSDRFFDVYDSLSYESMIAKTNAKGEGQGRDIDLLVMNRATWLGLISTLTLLFFTSEYRKKHNFPLSG